MKRVLILILLIIYLLSGCSGDNGVIPPPIQEVPPLDLIGEYTGRDNVVRYKDGIVTVCDITENTEDI